MSREKKERDHTYESCSQQYPLSGEMCKDTTIRQGRNGKSYSRKENQDGLEKRDKSMRWEEQSDFL